MSEKLVKATPHEILPVDPMDTLVQKAVESGAVDVLERLLAVKQQVHADQARAAFYTALIGFQNDCPVIGKSATANIKPGFSYTYTPIEDIAHAIRPLLNTYQLGYRWFTAQQGNQLTVTCRISHALGHIEETVLTVPVGSDPQRPAWPVAQSLTYAKRYTLCNALGIVVGGEDDDAQEPVAAPPSVKAPVAKATTSPPAPPTDTHDGRATDVVRAVTMKSGTTDGKAWTRYSITTDDGSIYSTFDKPLAEVAKALINTEAIVTFERSGKYLNATNIESCEAQAADEDLRFDTQAGSDE